MLVMQDDHVFTLQGGTNSCTLSITEQTEERYAPHSGGHSLNTSVL